jgi:hypothetical protein
MLFLGEFINQHSFVEGRLKHMDNFVIRAFGEYCTWLKISMKRLKKTVKIFLAVLQNEFDGEGGTLQNNLDSQLKILGA